MIRPIVKYGDPVLLEKSIKVNEIDDDIRTLVADMIETMHDNDGVGLAANQVGIAKQIAVVDVSAGENPDSVVVLINPEIIEESDDDEEFNEGCLSFPEIRINVVRPKNITVKALDLDGNEKVYEATDILARVFQHEIDHLNGIVFVDYLKGMAREMVLTKIKNLKKRGEWDD